MLIPGKAIVEQMGEYFVFVAKDTIMKQKSDSTQKKETDTAQSGPSLRAFQKIVKVGQVIGSDQIILSGIGDGDRIVVDGVQALHDGSEINTSKKHPSQTGSGEGKRK